MSRILPAALALMAFSTLGGSPARTIVDVTDFGASPDSGEDATVPFQRAIQAARAVRGPVTLTIPRGRYDFFSPRATRRACYFSNATESGSDAMRTIAMDLSGLDGLTMEGNGARLVMRGAMTMLVAERCRKLSIRNLTFDFARPTVSEMKAVEKGEDYWIGEVHPDSTYRLIGSRVQWFGEDWSLFHNLVQHFDPITATVWRGSDPTEGATAIDEIAPRRLRFSVPPESLDGVVVGRTYQFRDTARTQTGMWFNRCQDVAMEDVNIRAMAGFGVLFQYTEGIDLRRIEVAPSPESRRTCAAAADILHFSGCRGAIRVRDSVLTAAHDDAINIHGTHLQIVGREGARKIRVRFMHAQSWGFAAFTKGDSIEFVRWDTLQPYESAKVLNVEMTADPREQILHLDRDAPSAITLESDVVENVTWTPSVEIAGCQIAQIPTRGILVTTRRPVRIVGNCFFRTPLPAILVEDDAAGWYESGPVHDLLIRGNDFFECADETVSINPQNSVHTGPVHRNVRVEKNTFTMTGERAVSAKSTDRLRVTGNVFRSSSDARQPVKTTDSNHVTVEGNRWETLPDSPAD
ncbi:right-handed parallel beta-helix repeat-containing protein [bacterium]|nr:MAG: right-handed parallel beta-helix repeat-containing protein [bacterium]